MKNRWWEWGNHEEKKGRSRKMKQSTKEGVEGGRWRVTWFVFCGDWCETMPLAGYTVATPGDVTASASHLPILPGWMLRKSNSWTQYVSTSHYKDVTAYTSHFLHSSHRWQHQPNTPSNRVPSCVSVKKVHEQLRRPLKGSHMNPDFQSLLSAVLVGEGVPWYTPYVISLLWDDSAFLNI
jgi:hypothetical protein